MKRLFRILCFGIIMFIFSGIDTYACGFCEENSVVYLSAKDYTDTHVNEEVSKVALYYLDYTPQRLKLQLKNEVIKNHDEEHSIFLKSGIARDMSDEQIISAYADMISDDNIVDEVVDEQTNEEPVEVESTEQGESEDVTELEFEQNQSSDAPDFDPSSQREGLASYLLDYKYDDGDYIEYFINCVTGEFKGIGKIFKMSMDSTTGVVGAINMSNTAAVLVHFDKNTQEPIQMELSLNPNEYDNTSEYKSTIAFNDCFYEEDGSYSYTDCNTDRRMNMYMDEDQVLVFTFFKR